MKAKWNYKEKKENQYQDKARTVRQVVVHNNLKMYNSFRHVPFPQGKKGNKK